jgi:hypothetical protein
MDPGGPYRISLGCTRSARVIRSRVHDQQGNPSAVKATSWKLALATEKVGDGYDQRDDPPRWDHRGHIRVTTAALIAALIAVRSGDGRGARGEERGAKEAKEKSGEAVKTN